MQDQDIWSDDNSYVTNPHKIISKRYIRNRRLLIYSLNIIMYIRHQDRRSPSMMDYGHGHGWLDGCGMDNLGSDLSGPEEKSNNLGV
jgi:hypothetical protein